MIVFRQKDNFGSDWKLVKCVGLLEISALVFSMSLCNFSLAYIITLIYVPICLMVSPSASKVGKIIKSFLVFLIHPMCLLFVFCLIDSIRTFPEKSILGLLEATLSASKQAIMFSISDWYIYGNYAFSVATVCLLPCWFILWHVVCFTEDKVKTDWFICNKWLFCIYLEFWEQNHFPLLFGLTFGINFWPVFVLCHVSLLSQGIPYIWYSDFFSLLTQQLQFSQGKML